MRRSIARVVVLCAIGICVAWVTCGTDFVQQAKAAEAQTPADTLAAHEAQVLASVDSRLYGMVNFLGDGSKCVIIAKDARKELVTLLADPEQSNVHAWDILGHIGISTHNEADLVAGVEALIRLKPDSPMLAILRTRVNEALIPHYQAQRQLFIKQYEAASRGGDESQRKLGVFYASGMGIPRNEPESVVWYLKSAKQNNKLAQLALGLAYLQGLGVRQDDDESLKWFKAAAEQELPAALFYVGSAYAAGRGVAVDHVQAMQWYRKAASQDHAMAMGAIGHAYDQGNGVTKNENEAFKWYLKSAEHDDPLAQNVVGLFYLNGGPVEKDPAKAVEWFRNSALQGYAAGQMNLAAMYGNGTGVAQDMDQATKWLQLAVQKGYWPARLKWQSMQQAR